MRSDDHRSGFSNHQLLFLLALAILVLAGGGLVLVRSQVAAERPRYWRAPTFAMVDQAGDSVRSMDLRDAPWVASFIFTNCEGVCPLITSRMARVRDSLAAAGMLGGDGARLVSFSVDPARDTPQVLREYADAYGGSPPERWAFLTGGPPDSVLSMIQEGFRLTAVGPAPGVADTAANYQVNHSPRIVLIDEAGMIRGLYGARQDAVVDSVLTGVRTLLR